MKFILGLKIGMSHIFDETGKKTSVTLIEAGPCVATQIKDKGKNGYEAIQIGFKQLKEDKIKKPNKRTPFKHVKEFRGNIEISNYKDGDVISASVFEEGDVVKISGISKGKGFQGGVKRHGFAGRPATHGTKHEERTIGSTGSGFPQRVIKGRKMPGRMGSDRITVKNLKIVKVLPEENLLVVKGAVPGRKGTLLEIKS